MAGSPPNLHTMDSRSACIQDVLKVKVKGHVIHALSWILGMSYSVIDGLVLFLSSLFRDAFCHFLINGCVCVVPLINLLIVDVATVDYAKSRTVETIDAVTDLVQDLDDQPHSHLAIRHMSHEIWIFCTRYYQTRLGIEVLEKKQMHRS